MDYLFKERLGLASNLVEPAVIDDVWIMSRSLEFSKLA